MATTVTKPADEDVKGRPEDAQDEGFSLESGTLGSKSDNITTIPPKYVATIEQAWELAQKRPNWFGKVDCGTVAARDEFHAYGKAAARRHEPKLDYRKLPRPAEKENGMAYFTLRLWSDDPNMRPGRNPSNNGNSGN